MLPNMVMISSLVENMFFVRMLLYSLYVLIESDDNIINSIQSTALIAITKEHFKLKYYHDMMRVVWSLI